MKIQYEKISLIATKRVKCEKCGKRLKRRTTLYQTVSPHNKTISGNVKTRDNIKQELARIAEMWKKKQETCRDCSRQE